MPRTYNQKKPCAIAGCDMISNARGWCVKHYSRWRTNGDPNRNKYEIKAGITDGNDKICSSCKRRLHVSLFHRRKSGVLGTYARCKECARKYKRELYKNTICKAEGCGRRYADRMGMCSTHHHRWSKTGSTGPAGLLIAKRGTGHIRSDGYVMVHVNGELVGQHRVVMSEIIGRPLLKEETVHHKNGIRGDNRPENLELWTKSQPAGKRISDLLVWAKEIIRLYDGLPLFSR